MGAANVTPPLPRRSAQDGAMPAMRRVVARFLSSSCVIECGGRRPRSCVYSAQDRARTDRKAARRPRPSRGLHARGRSTGAPMTSACVSISVVVALCSNRRRLDARERDAGDGAHRIQHVVGPCSQRVEAWRGRCARPGLQPRVMPTYRAARVLIPIGAPRPGETPDDVASDLIRDPSREPPRTPPHSRSLHLVAQPLGCCAMQQRSSFDRVGSPSRRGPMRIE